LLKKTNSLDFVDFRKIILYFGLSIWTHIDIRKKVVRWHIYLCGFFRL